MNTNKSGLHRICDAFKIDYEPSDSLKTLAIKINDVFGYCKVSVKWNGAVCIRHEMVRDNLRFRNEILQEHKVVEMVRCKGCNKELPSCKFHPLSGGISAYCPDCRNLRRLRRKQK